MTDGNGAVTQYTYDDLNRLTVTAYLSDTETVTHTYDAAGNRLMMEDGLGTTRYLYDDFYRLISVTNPFSGTVLYDYDFNSNRTRLTYPDTKVVTYTYDADNRLIQVEDWEDGLTIYGYDPAGRLISSTLPNGVTTAYGYDDANRLTSLVHEGDNGLLLARFLYQLDKVGNQVVVTETLAAPGVGGLAALPGLLDNLLAGQEGPVTAEVVLAALTGAGTNTDVRPDAQAKPTLHSSGVPYPWSMNAAELAFAPPEQVNPASELTIRLARTTLTADGRDGAYILVLVTDAEGRPVADGTQVDFQVTGGQMRPPQATTTNGLVIAWLVAGLEAGPGMVEVRADLLTDTIDFALVRPSPGSLRVDEPAGGPPDQLPFDLAEVVERAGNTIESPEGRPPFIARPGHQAIFDTGDLRFTPQGEVTTTTPLSLVFQLSEVAIGEVSLFSGPATATVSLDGNIAHLVRGQNLVEEFVARDGGVEQRWQIPADPGLPGDLTIAVEVETALDLSYAPGGEGFIFQAIESETGRVIDVAGYGRAIALDTNGRAKRVWLSAEELE
jgi:YD repeat-containing protein